MTVQFASNQESEDAAPLRNVARVLSSGEVLGAAGLRQARIAAQGDALRRRSRLLLHSSHALDIDPLVDIPDPRLIATFGAELCLKHRILPWRRISGRVTVLASSPDRFLRVQDALTVLFGPVHLALIPPEKLDLAFSKMCHRTLMQNAESRTPKAESCRDWNVIRVRRWGIAAAASGILGLLIWPQMVLLALCYWAVFTLVLSTLLKAATAILHLRPVKQGPVPANPEPAQLPVISILVPLFRERDIATALVDRLRQIDYPRDRLDICLVLEADDGLTQSALADATLPPYMRAIKVPLGALQTKPRALNYALSFARGTIIGVYDAEDAPDPGQLRLVAQRFAERGPEVACLQGRLDYYNDRSNWLARCFTIEYATWFRIVLPGLERLGLVVPLGGTTLFFRRNILEALGGWDAHNVTEDADLGLRLARHGYRTEIIETTTQEEANARAWPWVKQRSRWLKGYAITYGVHMRNPVALWRDLGAWRFFGVQLLFAGTISQFMLAPLLWSFWLVLAGLPHPLVPALGSQVMVALSILFLATEVIGIAIMALAVTSAGKRHLIPWTPSLSLYFPLAAIAAYKGCFELATRPFFWDKTAHGVFGAQQALPINPPPQPLARPVAAE